MPLGIRETWGAIAHTYRMLGYVPADNWGDAIAIIEGMAGLNGLGSLDGQWQLLDSDLYLWLIVLLPVIWLAPNTQELTCDRDPVINFQAHPNLQYNILWRLRKRWLGPFAIACAVAAILVIVIRKAGSEDFIYMVF